MDDHSFRLGDHGRYHARDNEKESMVPRHPEPAIAQSVVEKVFKRRGRLHAFETLDPVRTALVVVDLDTRTMEQPDNGRLRSFAPKVNAIAKELRQNGGTVAWVTTPVREASENFLAIYGADFAKMHVDATNEHGTTTNVWSGLDSCENDIFVEKTGGSAFFPGNCDLHQKLDRLGIRSLLILGMVTNVCCESTARDATELDYQVTMVSDVMWGHKQGQHEATLTTFYQNFGDVRVSDDVIELIGNRKTRLNA